MIAILAEQCSGCGACLEDCPTGAILLVGGKAAVDATLCRECEACVAACPSEAIVVSTQEGGRAETAHLPALRPEPAVIWVPTPAAPVPPRSRILPALGAALARTARELLPWLVHLLDGRASRSQVKDAARGRSALAAGAKGGGRQYRYRQRRGRS